MSDADKEAIKEGTLAYNIYIRNTITLGGPMQTILTGFIGLAGLLVLNNRTRIDAWNTKHLFWIVLTYFHSREVFNVLTSYMNLATARGKIRGSRSDEGKLFEYWNINADWGYLFVLLISSAILTYVTFVLVKKHRWQLILFGGLGSFLGGWFWLFGGGEWLMP